MTVMKTMMIGSVVVIVLGVFLNSCGSTSGGESSAPATVSAPSISKAARAVMDEGYTNLVSTGIPLFQCSDSDSTFFNEGFDATNMSGKRVHVIACCGFLKGCTVRH